MLASFLALIVLLAGTSFAAAGQDPAGSGRIDPGSALAVKIQKAKRIRVVTPLGNTDFRRALILAEGVKSENDPSTLISWADIQKIRIMKRSTVLGMWIGLGVGLASGLGLAAEYEASKGRSIAAGLILGAAGALEGALVGSAFRDWKTVYKAPARPPVAARLSLAPTRSGAMMTLTVVF
jgi:hypothetical protein